MKFVVSHTNVRSMKTISSAVVYSKAVKKKQKLTCYFIPKHFQWRQHKFCGLRCETQCVGGINLVAQRELKVQVKGQMIRCACTSMLQWKRMEHVPWLTVVIFQLYQTNCFSVTRDRWTWITMHWYDAATLKWTRQDETRDAAASM